MLAQFFMYVPCTAIGTLLGSYKTAQREENATRVRLDFFSLDEMYAENLKREKKTNSAYLDGCQQLVIVNSLDRMPLGCSDHWFWARSQLKPSLLVLFNLWTTFTCNSECKRAMRSSSTERRTTVQ
jgi:hypothetical protein